METKAADTDTTDAVVAETTSAVASDPESSVATFSATNTQSQEFQAKTRSDYSAIAPIPTPATSFSTDWVSWRAKRSGSE